MSDTNNKDKTLIRLAGKLPKMRILLENAEKTRQDFLRTQQALRESEEMFRAVVQSTGDAVINADKNAVITFWNKGAERMFGYSSSEMLGQRLERIMPERFREAHSQGVMRVVKEGKMRLIDKTVELVALRKSGEEFPVELTLSMWEAGSDIFFSGIVRDITERKKTEERLNQLAFFDILTGLPNRMLFFDRLNQVLKQAQREKHLLGLFFIDLDKFKEINDTHGHDAGDSVLKETAKRLTDCVRESDTVARIGGDEFTILLPHIANVQDAAIVAQKIMIEFSKPFMFNGTKLFMGASIGISLYPYDGKTSDTLMKNADIAMYKAKKEEHSSVQFFSENK